MNYTEEHYHHKHLMHQEESKGSNLYLYVGLFFILLLAATTYSNYTFRKENSRLKGELKSLDSLVAAKHKTIEELKMLYLLKK